MIPSKHRWIKVFKVQWLLCWYFFKILSILVNELFPIYDWGIEERYPKELGALGLLPLITFCAYKLFLSQVFITWGIAVGIANPHSHRHGYASECVGRLICTKAEFRRCTPSCILHIFKTEIVSQDSKAVIKRLHVSSAILNKKKILSWEINLSFLVEKNTSPRVF